MAKITLYSYVIALIGVFTFVILVLSEPILSFYIPSFFYRKLAQAMLLFIVLFITCQICFNTFDCDDLIKS